MKFLFASDSFKGTLSSPKTAELLTQAAREIFPDCVCDSIEVADGGQQKQYFQQSKEQQFP